MVDAEPAFRLAPSMYQGGLMNTILLVVLTIAVCLITAFLIPLLIETKRTMTSLRRSTEEQLNPALVELQLNLENLKKITGDVNDMTADVKSLSHTIREAGETVHKVTEIVDDIGATASVKVVSARTGIRVALEYLLTNLSKKGDRA
jgi:methyl-accepting chemotaxis protein